LCAGMFRSLSRLKYLPAFFFRPVSFQNFKSGLTVRNIMIDIDTTRAAVAEQVKVDILSETQEAENAAYVKGIARTFISDTVTVPSKEMYSYAVKASLGDDVYHDVSTKALETHIAQLTGKESAIFLPSGTMSNQIALRTHLKQPPYSVLCDYRAHINKYEVGGAAFHSGATVIAVIPSNAHHLTLEDIKAHVIIGDDVHFSPTEIIALENTLNGTIIPQDEVIAISNYAHSQGMKMHLDGARIWHVAAETGTSIKELCDPFDSVSVCFSKGLGAPVGSCLVGPAEFIKKARWFRKLFGAGMRQTGMLCASAAFALTHNYPLLPGVHTLARRLEKGLEDIGAEISSRAETCMVFYDPSPIGLDYGEIADRAAKLPDPIMLAGSRLVVHIQTSQAAVDDFLKLIRELAEEKKKAGFVPSPKPNQNGIFKDIYVRRKALPN
jgi:threonine aldolase